METPLVTVICLSYNHAQYVREAITSVFDQTHSNTQLIIVDDGSNDGSQDVIRETIKDHPEVVFVALDINIGNCRAFNRGLALATGEYIIDLAADDVLLPTRLTDGINSLAAAGPRYGVTFSDAELVSAEGLKTGLHSDRFKHHTIPQGEIYKDVISRYFINSPTMMSRSEVFKKLGGYDESLAYEDFDYWVRSARDFLYCYNPKPLVRRRIVESSMTRQQYKRNSPQMRSTLIVCRKIKTLNRDHSEDKALKKRIWYEIKKAFAVGELGLVWEYVVLFFSISR